jgi:hypothetical protein
MVASKLACAGLLLLPLAACAGSEAAPETAAQGAYASPDAAGQALASALRQDSGDALARVLGPEAHDLLESGDPVQDRNDRARFLERYDEHHATEVNADGSATLLVGRDDWPFPIPLVQEAGGWRFDDEGGVEELINRRVGANELSTIEVCRAIVDAQREYRQLDPEGKGCYASTFFSDAGRRNGLYWETAPGEPESPMGERVAEASREGYKRNKSGPAPYHGYHYGLLLAQGPHAPGGARSYLSEGNLTGGFAVIAWPAEYGQSGVMTFIAGSDGIVYERDLGEQTSELAAALETFDPDASWSVCEEGE